MLRREFLQGTGATFVGLFQKDESEADRRKRCDAEAIKAHELLERLAAEMEPEVLRKQDELLAACIAEDKRQSDGFKFSCKKFGDFLTIFIERSGNPDKPQYIDSGPARYTSRMPDRKFSTTLNLGKTREIKREQGNPADKNGLLKYYYRIVYGEGETIGGTGFGNYIPTQGEYVVRAWYPETPYDRQMFSLDPPPPPPPQGNVFHIGDDSYSIKFKTEPYARTATDDTIRFEGIGATVFVPHSLGERVHTAILKELAAR